MSLSILLGVIAAYLVPPTGLAIVGLIVGVAYAACVYCDCGNPFDALNIFSGLSDCRLVPRQGTAIGGMDDITYLGAVGWGLDTIVSYSHGEDLSAGGGVDTFGAGMGARFLAGLWEGSRMHLLLGVEWRKVLFEQRPDVSCVGPYVGAGLELMSGYDFGFTAMLRYNWLDKSLPDYDLWEFTVGLSKYW